MCEKMINFFLLVIEASNSLNSLWVNFVLYKLAHLNFTLVIGALNFAKSFVHISNKVTSLHRWVNFVLFKLTHLSALNFTSKEESLMSDKSK